MSQFDHLLILGASRGGTTIVAAALGAHPDLAILDEDLHGGLNKITGGKLGGVKLCVPNQIEFDKRWQPLYAPGLMSGFLRKSLFMNRIPKSPLSIRDYDQYGEIRHVCVLRHPAGVISGIMKRENRRQGVAAYRWRRCVEVFKTLDDTPQYSPVFISFERLVTAPERTLKGLCDTLAIPFTQAMMAAPSRNTRYKGPGFDSSKAQYENGEEIWSLFPPHIKSLYNELSNKAV